MRRGVFVDALQKVLEDHSMRHVWPRVSMTLPHHIHGPSDYMHILRRNRFDHIVKHAYAGSNRHPAPVTASVEDLVPVEFDPLLQGIRLRGVGGHLIKGVSERNRCGAINEQRSHHKPIIGI